VSRRDFWTILYRLAKEGMTVLVTTAYLDEAERCDRVGLMHRGRIIELDTPQQLRDDFAPYCFAIRSQRGREVRGWLQGQPDVLSAEPAGALLHLYLQQPGIAAGEVQARLHAAGYPDAEVRSIAPALEDLFIARIRRQERHERN